MAVNPLEPVPQFAAAPVREETFGLISVFREITEIVLLAAVMFFGIRSVVQQYYIESISMLPTLHEGQFLMIDKFAYCPGLHVDVPNLHLLLDREVCLWQPQRGDVIVFRYPHDPSQNYIKRVIGLPGDTVDIRNGQIFINGVQYTEHFGENAGSYSTNGPVTVSPEQYYVLGDNRNSSSDSHIWGTVPMQNIIGKAMLRYWPLSDFTVIGHGNGKPLAATH